jgi:ribonuclease HI
MERYGFRKSILSYFQECCPKTDVVEPAYTELPAVPIAPKNPIDIFCDGACYNNGRRGAKGAFAISIQRNGLELACFSNRLKPEEPQTNQRAELRALECAVTAAASQASADRITIYSDSEYAIHCMTRWAPTWKRSKWTKADKEPVQHRDIIEPLYEKWQTLYGKARIEHVRAHTEKTDVISRGNARADELATSALSYE